MTAFHDFFGVVAGGVPVIVCMRLVYEVFQRLIWSNAILTRDPFSTIALMFIIFFFIKEGIFSFLFQQLGSSTMQTIRDYFRLRFGFSRMSVGRGDTEIYFFLVKLITLLTLS